MRKCARRSGRVYRERLKFETNTIIKMGFPGYFLIVADFINWAKNNGVPVGPGRGSGAGSLVAYSLAITDLDPLRYNLLFERFLNPERVSMPDFDIDFCQEGRDRVIQYVKEQYGEDAVSQIATFGTMAAKARGARRRPRARHGLQLLRRLPKLIPFKPGKLVTIADARRDEEPLLKEREENRKKKSSELLELAQQVEGIAPQHRHARGRRADRARQADRFLPAVHAGRRRRRRCRSTTRMTSKRSAW